MMKNFGGNSFSVDTIRSKADAVSSLICNDNKWLPDSRNIALY